MNNSDNDVVATNYAATGTSRENIIRPNNNSDDKSNNNNNVSHVNRNERVSNKESSSVLQDNMDMNNSDNDVVATNYTATGTARENVIRPNNNIDDESNNRNNISHVNRNDKTSTTSDYPIGYLYSMLHS